MRVGNKGGKTTFLKVSQDEAPKDQAASSNSLSISCNTGCTVLTTKGKETKIIAIATPVRVKTTFIPRLCKKLPSQPSGLQTVAKVKPATDVGKAKGKSIAASSVFLPGKSYRTKTHAKIKPKTPFIKLATKAMERVTQYAETAIGSVANNQNLVNKVSLAVAKSEIMGTINTMNK